MIRKSGFLGLAGGALLALAACGPGTPAGDGGTPTGDGGTTPPPAMTYTYVLNNLTVDMTDDPTVPVAGFNLDNLWSDGSQTNDCSKPDSPSSTDIDQNCMGVAEGGNQCPAGMANAGCMYSASSTACRGGVDNQLPVIANTIDTIASPGPGGVRGAISGAVAGHQFSLLVRITDVNGTPGPTLNDDNVTLKLYLAYPTRTSNCMGVTADQEYVVDANSVNGSDIEMAKFQFQGRIVNGRLSVRAGSGDMPFNLPLPAIMGANLSLALRSTQLRITMNADGTGSNGNLGAYVKGNDLVDAVAAIPQAAMYRMQLVGVLGGLIDVQVDGVCATSGANPMFGGLGLGLGFTTVPARLAATPIVMARPAGACGSSSM